MLRSSIILPSLCFLFFISLVPQIFASSNSTEETGDYVNQQLGFSFHPPDNWTVQELKKTQPNAPDVVVVGTKIEGFAPSISISIENSNGTSLEDYVKDVKIRLQPAVDAGRLIFLSDETKKINGYDSEILESKGEFLSQNQGFIIKFREAIISTNDKFYIITYANQEKNFNDDLQRFEDVMNSFQMSSSHSEQPQTSLILEIGIGIAAATGAGVVAVILTKRKRSKESQHNT